jgi:hypothetical protein
MRTNVEVLNLPARLDFALVDHLLPAFWSRLPHPRRTAPPSARNPWSLDPDRPVSRPQAVTGCGDDCWPDG